MKTFLRSVALATSATAFVACQTTGPGPDLTPKAAPKQAPKCPETTIILLEDAEWLPSDETVLNTARRRCGELYKKSPCVKQITKAGSGGNVRYRVVCGANHE